MVHACVLYMLLSSLGKSSFKIEIGKEEKSCVVRQFKHFSGKHGCCMLQTTEKTTILLSVLNSKGCISDGLGVHWE